MKVPVLVSLGAMLTIACGGSTEPGVNAHIRFVTDALFCSDPHPVNFCIDNVQVGRDTLWFGVDPDTFAFVPPVGSQKYKSYRSFGVQAGIHTVRAMLVDTILPLRPPLVYSWPDTTVTVAVGAEVVRRLPFYCS